MDLVRRLCSRRGVCVSDGPDVDHPCLFHAPCFAEGKDIAGRSGGKLHPPDGSLGDRAAHGR